MSLSQVYERAAALPAPTGEVPSVAAELARVVIYLEGNLPLPVPVKAEMNQTQRRFEPELLVISAGSTVSFPNSNPIFHNVFSLFKIKSFDLGNYSKGQSRSVQFARPGVVTVHCHLHPNMNAAIVVAPSSFVAQPDSDGRFSLSGIPAGRYTAVAWHKSAG